MPSPGGPRLTEPTELLFRQVAPSFLKVEDHLSSQIFFPSKKDEGLLSIARSAKIEALGAFTLHVQAGYQSAGVLGVTVAECEAEELPAYDDPLDSNPAHGIIDFRDCSRGQKEKRAKKLLHYASQRDYCYKPITSEA